MNEEENTISNLTKEDISYIYSEEFISKFGDWEKANRLEKLKKSKPLFLDKKNYDQSLSTIEKGRLLESIKKIPEVLNEEKDFALMSDISDVLSEGEIFTKRNENIDDDIKIKLGDLFDKKNPEKIQPTGLRHLIKHRMEERLNNGLSMEDSQKETTAILFLAVNNIDKVPAVKEPNGKYAIYKDGIRTTIGKDKKGKFVVSGFDYADTKREATDSIGTVIARYGYTPGFLEIYDQVGAVASELNIQKKNSVVNDTIRDKKPDYEKLLYNSAEINVNGRIRHCKTGLIKGFENAVSRLDSCFAENSSLKNENIKLKSRLELMNNKCEKLIQDNEELKNQALKNKIRPMGM